MQCACEIGVVRDPANLKGTQDKIDEFEIYVARPEKPNGIGVIVVHDIYGYVDSIPNSAYIADHFARNGFFAVLPNYYHDTGAWKGDTKADADAFAKWRDTITSGEFWAKLIERTNKTVDFIKREGGVEKVAIMGFCWGGKAATVAASHADLTACVTAHGAFHSTECVEKSKCPVFFICVPGDNYFNDEKQEEIRKYIAEHSPKSSIKAYEGSFHGFVNRGPETYEGKDSLKAKADEAMADAIEFITKNAQ